MAAKVKWKFVYLCATFVIIFKETFGETNYHDTVPSQQFSSYTEVTATIHRRGKREALYPGLHSSHAELHIRLAGQPHILDLRLNRQLLAKNIFIRTDHANGTYNVHKPHPQEEELCQYTGSVRGFPDSRAAVSLCNGDGMRGMVIMEDRTFYLEPGLTSLDHTVVYDSNDIIPTTNRTCGFPDSPHHIPRVRRDVEAIRGPYNENEQSRYVELVMVLDHEEYRFKGEHLPTAYKYCKDIVNIVNSLFVPLNIYVALVGVVVWTEEDQIVLSADGNDALTHFLRYRRERLVNEHPNDNAQLLTKKKFDHGVVGKALKGPICTYEYSGGVSMDHSTVLGLVAATVAHEMGHNFGMEHDNAECDCPDEKCIMAPSSSHTSPTHWSSCSLEQLTFAFEHGMDYCLRNKPTKLFDSPQCGNWFVEPGEQCDCGLPEHCSNTCCDPQTCMLYENATCATGRCCDLKTCKPKTAGKECRKAKQECDLPEYCSGESEYCPDDIFKIDGETCNYDKAYCYKGRCTTHTDQCKLLWGDSANNSDLECYEKNKMGTRNGNCGFNRFNNTYHKCNDTHVHCGMLHCKHQSERLEFGMESVSVVAQTFINKAGAVVPCRTAMVDLGLNEVDPGLAPDGAKCGVDMMCVNQKCMSVSELRALAPEHCPENCNGNGVCNSKGQCHCHKGFAPPLCKVSGPGGSHHSGPASDSSGNGGFSTALYIIFLGVVPCIALACYLRLYYKRDPRFWRQLSKPPSTPSSNALLDGHAVEKGNKSDANSNEGSGSMVRDGSPVAVQVQNQLIGHFNGFTIKPLNKGSGPAASDSGFLAGITKSPSGRMTNKWSNGTAVKPPAAPNVSFISPKPKIRNPPPSDPVVKVDIGLINVPDAPHRVEISSPVLEGTTSDAAKELADVPILHPTRPAPAVPVPAHQDVAPPPPIPPALPQEQPSREYPTLTRIANIMRNASMRSVNEKQRKPRIDKDKLRGIEISNPIPQVDTAGEVADNTKTARPVSIQRAQSMREATPPRQAPHSFGSMRSTKRPTSVHVPSRPPEPPPLPPAPKDSYDDCLNLLAEKQAPLAHIDEENSPTAPDNIYAVIEEPPKTTKAEKVVRFTDEGYKVPKSSDPVVLPPLINVKSLSTSSESMGLLGEIVNEISSRNVESIYSTGTLQRKKKLEEEAKAKEVGRYENAGLEPETSQYQASDVSSASSSNGYLSPNKINLPPPPQTHPSDIEQAQPSSLKEIDLKTYKPYASSFVRNSGPLSMAYSKKPDSPSTTDVTSSTATNGTFSRPGLLSTPTPTKFTPQSITSSFRSPKTSTTSPTPVTISKERGISDNVSSTTSKIPPKVAPRPKDKALNVATRPLPTIPKNQNPPAAPLKPLPAVPKTESDVKNSIKKPSEIAGTPRIIGKPTPPSAALKPKIQTNA